MRIAVVGLGIIGGSYAKALKKYTDHYVIGINRSPLPLQKALACGAIDEIGTEDSLTRADIIILCSYPQACVDFVTRNAEKINKNAIVTDSAGIKSQICPQLTELAGKYGFTFIGSHPMAGKEKNGFDASEAELFQGASFIIVPCGAEEHNLDILSSLALSLGFKSIRVCSAREHDEMIAFTSQLPHVLACAYVMSPRCPNHKGFSAGSYRDVSRVASINAQLWSELFLENREPLISELNILIDNITKIKDAVNRSDKDGLCALLNRGRKIKEELGE